MTSRRKESIIRSAGIAAAVVVTLCAGLLVLQHMDARHLEALYRIRFKGLEQEVKTSAEASNVLTAEREWFTVDSMQRDSFTQTVGTLLIIGSGVFLVSMNWLASQRGRRVLPLARLVQLQTAPLAGQVRKTAASMGAVPQPSPVVDLSVVESIVAREGRGKEAAIPILRAIQVRFGYLPDEALKNVCELTEITPAQIAGTSSFYAQFRRSPVGKHIVRICHGTACHVSGIVQISEELRRHLGIPIEGDTDSCRLFTLDKVACLGCCSLAPVMMIDEVTVGRLTPASACESLHLLEPELPA